MNVYIYAHMYVHKNEYSFQFQTHESVCLCVCGGGWDLHHRIKEINDNYYRKHFRSIGRQTLNRFLKSRITFRAMNSMVDHVFTNIHISSMCFQKIEGNLGVFIP